MSDTYEIYAIRYGHHPRKASENFLGGDPHDVDMPLDYFVWAIVGEARTILVDTGFDQAVGTRRGRQTVKPVADGLAAIGIDPANVATIIVSHLHYDHSGNYDLFPRARYHLQDREMEYATGRAMCHQAIRNSFEPDYVVAMVRKVFAGRVEFHDGDDLIAPGVSVHHIGGHTKGLQSVRVDTRTRPHRARGRRRTPLRSPPQRPGFPDRLQRCRDAGRLWPSPQACGLAATRRAGARSDRAQALSGREARARRLDRPARRGTQGLRLTHPNPSSPNAAM